MRPTVLNYSASIRKRIHGLRLTIEKQEKIFNPLIYILSGLTRRAWMARLNQSFWKRKLTVDAAIRKNDFVSPIAAPSFDSKTIFKSLQATLRIPHYPFISVGYYPGSQLSLSNNNVLTGEPV